MRIIKEMIIDKEMKEINKRAADITAALLL